MQFTKVYQADQEEDCIALHELLRSWLVGPTDADTSQRTRGTDRQRKTIWIPDLVKRLKHFRLQLVHEPESQLKNAWLKDLHRVQSLPEQPDGDATMAAPPSALPVRRDRTETLSNEAAQHLHQALVATDDQPALPRELTAQLSLTTHAYVATAIARAKHGQLMVQLPGGIRIDEAATYSDLLAQIDGHTPTMAEAARRFKSVLVGAYQDLASNRVILTIASKALAEDWAGEQIAIKNRLVVLQRLRTEAMPDGNDALDPATYSITVCNLGGTLSYLDIWHLFHGLLRLEIVDISQAPADATGLINPTRWIIVLRHRGCPAQLLGKTRIAWGTENVWIHHTAFARQPPCTRCDASKCSDAKATHPSAVITVVGPLLDITDAMASLTQQGPNNIPAILQQQEARLREQSLMGGEDTPAPEHTGAAHPVGPPLVVPATDRVQRPRLWRRICDFERTQIVRKLLRLRELAAASEEWRLEAHSYRAQPREGTSRPPEADNDHLAATLRLFHVTATRPVPEIIKPEVTDVETDKREKLNWPEDPELRDAISRKWMDIKKQVAAALAKERRRSRIEIRKEERALAAARAAKLAADASIPFTSLLQQAAQLARQKAMQSLIPFNSALQRAAQATVAGDVAQPGDELEFSAVHDDIDGVAADEGDLPENMDCSGVPSGVLVPHPLETLRSGPFGMATGAKKPAHLDYPASLLPGMLGRERVKHEAARPYEAKHKRGSKPAIIMRAVDTRTGDIQRAETAHIRRNGKRDNGQSTITRHFAVATAERRGTGESNSARVSSKRKSTATGAGTETTYAPVQNEESREDADVELLKVVPAEQPLRKNDDIWKQLLDDLQLIEVNTPPDGHCFFPSCYAIKTGVCPARIGDSRHRATTRKEAAHYRRGCYV